MTKRGPYAGTKVLRQQILAVAEELVLEHGHQTTTAKMVASQLGMSEAAVFYHFPTKEALLVEMLRWRDTKLVADGDTDIVESLIKAVRDSPRQPRMLELTVAYTAAAVDPDHPAHDFYAERYRLVVREFKRRLEVGLPANAIDAGTVADMFIGLADGLQVRWLVGHEVDLDTPLRTLSELLGLADIGDSTRNRPTQTLVEYPAPRLSQTGSTST